MARSFISDPLFSQHFALIDVPIAGLIPLAFPYKVIRSALNNGAFIGMQAISTPTMTLQTRAVQEGNWPFEHTILTGFHTGGDVILRQAVLPLALDMYTWWQQATWGRIGPRRNFIIAHLRADRRIPARLIWLKNCVPTSFKPSSDFDAGTTAVAMEELTMRADSIDIVPVPFEEIQEAFNG